MPIDVEAVVLSNTRLSDDFNVLALDAPEVATRARPGQFVMIKPNGGTDPLLRRPFSVFQILRGAANEPSGLTIFNKRIGRGTSLLFEAKAGSRLACLGPLGRGFSTVDPPAEAWLVAGGVGLAPFLMLAESLRDRGTRTTLFYGGRRRSDLFFVQEFEQIGVRVVLSTEDGSRGTRGLVTVPLEAALAARAGGAHLYACGPTPMMRAVARAAEEHGCACEVSLEQVMGCGLGGCYSCVVGLRGEDGRSHFTRSCVEGPVFDARRVAWATLGH